MGPGVMLTEERTYRDGVMSTTISREKGSPAYDYIRSEGTQ